MRALVVEQGWSRGALAGVRALSAAGWTVGVASPGRRGLASSSRHCARTHRVPLVQQSSDAFVESVASVVGAGSYDVVFGAGEAELLALSAGRDAVPAVFPHARHDVVLRAADKARLSQAAEGVGIAVPESIDVDDIADERTPVVVKARLHARSDRPGAPPRIDTLVVTGRSAAQRRSDDVRSMGGDPEVQVFHTGTLVAYAAVRGSEGIVADSLQQASHIWPLRAGASARAVTLPADDLLTKHCAALLEELEWFGLAELQFIVGDDGVPRLIDLTAAFTGRCHWPLPLGPTCRLCGLTWPWAGRRRPCWRGRGCGTTGVPPTCGGRSASAGVGCSPTWPPPLRTLWAPVPASLRCRIRCPL